jgi:hypothetical protein
VVCPSGASGRRTERLSELAARAGRTVEQEAKGMLEESVGLARKRAAEAARRIRESHGRRFSGDLSERQRPAAFQQGDDEQREGRCLRVIPRHFEPGYLDAQRVTIGGRHRDSLAKLHAVSLARYRPTKTRGEPSEDGSPRSAPGVIRTPALLVRSPNLGVSAESS